MSQPEVRATPGSWPTVSVGSLAAAEQGSLTDGPFGSNLKTSHYTSAGPQVIRLQNIGDGNFKEAPAHISQEHFERLGRHEARAGDVVIAMLGETLPRACLVPPTLGPAIVKADCVRLRVDPERADQRFVMYGLNSELLRKQAAALMHGVGRPRLGLARFRALEFPLPSLEVQKQVVSALDSYFSRLDEVEGGLERVQRNLKRYRASVLQAAVTGRLVPTEAELARAEGREYEPATELLKRILLERRKKWEESGRRGKYEEPAPPDTANLPQLPEGWCWATVDAVGDVLLGRQRAPQFLTGKFYRPYLRVANVKDDRIDFTDLEEMDFDPVHFGKYRLQSGDILVSEGQSPELLGQSAIFRGEIEGLCFQKTLHRFRPFRTGPAHDFAQVVFRSHVKNGVFMRLGSITTNIAHLTLEKFKTAPFPLPPSAEQERISSEVQRILSIADETDQEIRLQVARIAKLRQALLRAAFSGKLTSQGSERATTTVALEGEVS